MNGYIYIIIFSLLLILSHFYSFISNKYKIPSVILLIFTGIITKIIAENFGVYIKVSTSLLQTLGTVGLILIVLEGALELEIRKDKMKILKRALLLSVFALLFSSTLVGVVIMFIYNVPFLKAILYGIPVSVISSAIVIPSIKNIAEEKKELLIYESAFSDILGIILFNFFAFGESTSFKAVPHFIFTTSLAIIIAFVLSLFLIFLLSRGKGNVKIVVILSMLMLIYSIGKFFHLSSLILILVFGLMINNFDKITLLNEKMKKVFNNRNILFALRELTVINGELAFTIRTIFFFTFGYSFDIFNQISLRVLIIGFVLILIIYSVRFACLKLIAKNNITLELFIAPRGLITILLYYAIPSVYRIDHFDEGILFLIVIITSLLMVKGLLTSKSELNET